MLQQDSRNDAPSGGGAGRVDAPPAVGRAHGEESAAPPRGGAFHVTTSALGRAHAIDVRNVAPLGGGAGQVDAPPAVGRAHGEGCVAPPCGGAFHVTMYAPCHVHTRVD
jgi:hypothetical protein